MLEEIKTGLETVGIYPLIAILIFIGLSIMAIRFVTSRRMKDYDRVKDVPLDGVDDESGQLQKE